MRYSSVHVEAMGYELPPVVVTSGELEGRLAPMYEKLRISPGQLELMTGITERRWWNEGFVLSDGAAAAAKKALAKSGVPAMEIETLIYAGVCRENFEPATACAVAAKIGVAPNAFVYDISNACLGVINGIIDVANRIELGQIKAGMVVSCETAREINELTIKRMLANPTMAMFTQGLATLTGGSGAVAVILVHESLLKKGAVGGGAGRKLLGGVAHTAPEHHALCRWGIAREGEPMGPAGEVFMATDSISVLKYGVELGTRTWRDLLRTLEWSPERVDKIVCHQVGSGHRSSILKLIEIPPEKDFSTFSYLGNIGTVSLPITAALAEQRGFLKAGSGQRVAFLGDRVGIELHDARVGVVMAELKKGFDFPDYPFEGKSLDLRGIRMNYVDEGRKDAPPVLMLHGNPTWSFYYRRLILALRDTHRVIVPDHVGMGLSERPDEKRYDYTLGRRVIDLEKLIESLALKQPITLVLHDWGGMIGMAFATNRPEKIGKIVVLNTGGFGLPRGKKMPWQLTAARTPGLGALLVRGFNGFSRGAVKDCVMRPLSREVARGYLAPYDSWKNRLAVHRFIQDIPLRKGDRAFEVVDNVERNLSQFQDVPMLICWGMKDFVFDQHFLKRWEELFPGATVHRFEDAGHYVLEDAHERIIPLVKAFCGEAVPQAEAAAQ